MPTIESGRPPINQTPIRVSGENFDEIINRMGLGADNQRFTVALSGEGEPRKDPTPESNEAFFARQEEQSEAEARLMGARADVQEALGGTNEQEEDIDHLKMTVNLPTHHPLSATPNYQPPVAAPEKPPAEHSNLENARFRKVTVIDAQPKDGEKPKKRWYQ